MTSTIDRLARMSGLMAAALFGIVAARPVEATNCTGDTSNCVIDHQGPDDVPGQKDLTRLCHLGSCGSGGATLAWQFDDSSWTGSNTGDACALIDTNADGLADRAICVTVYDGQK